MFVGAVREPPEIRALLEAPLHHKYAMTERHRFGRSYSRYPKKRNLEQKTLVSMCIALLVGAWVEEVEWRMQYRCDQAKRWTISGGGAMYGQHYGWMNNMMGWGMWMVPWGWIIIIVLVVIFFFALGGRAGQRPSGTGGPSVEEKWDSETPMDILKKRYARGEISREDFEQMKKDLSS